MLFLLVFNLYESHPDFGGDRAAFVIGGLDFDPRAVVLVVNVFFRTRENHYIAARADEAGFTLFHAARAIGDLGFQTVREIVRIVFVNRRNVKSDFQTALRVQSPFALLYQVVAVAVVALFVNFAFASAYAVVFIAEPPMVITRAVDVILHVAAGHRLAEEIFGLYVEFGLFADRH